MRYLFPAILGICGIAILVSLGTWQLRATRGVDVDELKQIAAATNGTVQVAQTPDEIKRIFLKALSRRIQ